MIKANIIRNRPGGLQDWQKKLAESYTHPAELLVDLDILSDVQELNPADIRRFPMRVPPSFVQRMKKGDPDDPLLRQVLPVADELIFTPGFARDPLAEQDCAGPGWLHKYANRVLFVVSGRCAVNCRYCFRRYSSYRQKGCDAAQWQTALDYVSARPSVNEVIFSGGDPLMAAGNQRQGQQNPAGFVFGVKLPISINDIDVFLHFL
jgi:KamA family protein